MYANYHDRQTPQFQALSDQQAEAVYLATLDCLQRTGVEVRNEEARQLSADAGARVDGSRAYIPPTLVQDAIAVTPRSFILCGRDGMPQMQIALGGVYFGPGPPAPISLIQRRGSGARSGVATLR